MKYLTGASNQAAREAARRLGIGLMVQPGNRLRSQIRHYPFYAADSGCFNPKTYPGHRKWLLWVRKLPPEGCLFATCPDVARRPDGTLGGDPEATWRHFVVMAPMVRHAGLPVALVAQDGMEAMANVDEQLAACDVLFLGGSTEWKCSPAGGLLVARWAREAGKATHAGRVNSKRRYQLMSAALIDSADGNMLAHGGDRNVRFLYRWFTAGAQLSLFGEDGPAA